MRIYAMSDIHGCLDQLEGNMRLVDLSGDNKLVLVGDYIDYGEKSGQVLRYIYELEQSCGRDKVIVLKGNHEAMFLDWLAECKRAVRMKEPEDYWFENQWLYAESGSYMKSFQTMVTEEQLARYDEIAPKASRLRLNTLAAEMIVENNREIIEWLKKLRLFYETDKQIFVHAGVDEEAEEYWQLGTEEDVFLWKYPAVKGTFIKTIIAGHVGTHSIAGDADFHDVFYDGASHYYIDGTVYSGGKLPLLMIDTDKDKYYQVTKDGMRVISKS